VTDKPVGESLSLLSFKRPTRLHHCNSRPTDYWQFSLGDTVMPNASSIFSQSYKANELIY